MLPGTERARACGGDGTPRVAEFAVAELAVLLGVGHGSAVHLLRDALDVRERHPLWWAQITAVAHADPAAVADGSVAGVRVWQARRVAGMCHAAGLDRGQARWVDAATTRYAASLPWGRFEALVAAKIIEADPAGAAARERAAAMRRFVATGQTNEHGLKTLIVQANAGDVICLVALLDRVARILAVQGDTDPVAVRRAKAVEIVANPYACVRLLERHATPDQQPDAQQTSDRTPKGSPATSSPVARPGIRRAARPARRPRRRTPPTTAPPRAPRATPGLRAWAAPQRPERRRVPRARGCWTCSATAASTHANRPPTRPRRQRARPRPPPGHR